MSGLSRRGQMSERKQFRAIKGTRDILPSDSALWNWFEHTAREVFESYNFGEIRLPVFEEIELFARSVGEETDIVAKEMYTFDQIKGKLETYRSALVNPNRRLTNSAQILAFSQILAAFFENLRNAQIVGLLERVPPDV